MGTINPHFQVNQFSSIYPILINQERITAYESSSRDVSLETENEIDSTLVILINSVYYFLECVYILKKKNKFNLIVIHNGRVLTYKVYSSLKGAKIAFQKLYRDKAWKLNVKALWTQPYHADQDWLNEKDEMVSHSLTTNKPLKAYSI